MTTQNTDKIESAKAHISQALEDIKAYCSEDIPKQSKDISDDLEEKVLNGIDVAADTIIETLFKVKRSVRKASQKEDTE